MSGRVTLTMTLMEAEVLSHGYEAGILDEQIDNLGLTPEQKAAAERVRKKLRSSLRSAKAKGDSNVTTWCLEVYDTEMREARSRKYTRSMREAARWKRIPKIKFTDSGHGLVFQATPHARGARRLPTVNPYGYAKHEMEQRQRERAYERDYNRGWRANHRQTAGALEKADKDGEPQAWYDGYHDGAAGREKWHLRDCEAHHNETATGGCGVA